jgi:hypothetical protein
MPIFPAPWCLFLTQALEMTIIVERGQLLEGKMRQITSCVESTKPTNKNHWIKRQRKGRLKCPAVLLEQ